VITMRVRRSILLTASVATVSALALSGCASGDSGPSSAVKIAAAPALAPLAASVASTKCKDGQNQVASLAPGDITTDPSTVKNSPTLNRIRKNGYLTVGTSGDVRLWGATNPTTGDLEGYDIDLLAAVAKAAGVDPAKTVYKVINYGQRLTALQSGSVDLVAHTMTINCARWQGSDGQPNAINFSSEYYRAGQKLLVRKDSPVTTVKQLVARKESVCVPSDSTNYDEIKGVAGLTIVQQDVVGDCLVKFQEGEVSAITGDDTVLAGFAAQDPLAHVAVAPAFTEEPYGMGIKQDDPEFTRFVNAVLEKLRTDGTLKALYAKWMQAAVGGTAPPVPQPVYGRELAKLGRS
jgi:polar amino acid transport system substrate-binding protein